MEANLKNSLPELVFRKSSYLFLRCNFYLLLLLSTNKTSAQITVSEGFDNNFAGTTWPNLEMPLGWTQGKITPTTDWNNNWDRVNSTFLPNWFPRSGAGMMRYRSAYCINAGERAYITSRPYDLSARGAGVTSLLRFWMSRDNSTLGNDNIQVRISNNPDPTVAGFATLVDNVYALSTINRPCASAPTPPVTCGGWNLYEFIIPANTWSINNLYVSLIATNAGVGNANIYIDDFSIEEYPAAMVFNSINFDFQNVANVGTSSTNEWIIGCRIQVTGSGTPLTLGAFTFLYNGCTSPANDINYTTGVKLWWTGGTNAYSPTNAVLVNTYSGVPAFPVPSWTMIPTGMNLQNGNNYFWLTYDIQGTATKNDFVDADFLSAVVGGTTYPPIVGTLPGARKIIAYCVPSYTAGTSGIDGSYTNNDYIKRVIVTNPGATDPIFTILDNDHNDIGPTAPGAGFPADPCVTSAGMINGGPSPFSAHPSDYQMFSIATVPNLCGAGNSTRTTSFLKTTVSPPTYNFSAQCGTSNNYNYIGAWIDFNHDGVFNNWMWNLAGGERIFQSTAMGALSWQNANFQIPAWSTYFGNTILRVREWNYNPNIDPCTPGYYGEVEDYEITIRPDCNPAGWKVWLGYTDDWSRSSNWCGGIPTINDDALVARGGTLGTYHPVIKSGVLATARKLRIDGDTVEINSPTPGSLRVSDSLSIGVSGALNTSELIVDSAYSANAVLSNGVNINNNFLPFRAIREQKIQLMYKTSELLTQGMMDGDIIDQIIIPVRQRGSTAAYPANINMYYATTNATYPSFTTLGFNSTVPAAPTNCLAPQQTVPVNVFSGNISFLGIPLSGSGNVTVNLTTPFTFSTGSNSPLIVEICFSLPVTSASDLSWQTQTTGYRSVLLLGNFGAYSTPACSWTNAAPNGSNISQRLTSDLRPNLTFKYRRSFSKYPINLESNGASTAHWANYGMFVPANSIVEFKGSSPVTQNIDGANNTAFNELKINTTGTGNARQNKAATVNDTLWLQQGRLLLNQKTLTINNGLPGAITQLAPNGFLQSETVDNTSILKWSMNTITGPHTIPFANASGVQIPFTFNLASGNAGDVTVSTYPTIANNTPYPATPTLVT
ncbi:MAG: GEVED domain-containing protein, partial [Bacteroidota bacterium]